MDADPKINGDLIAIHHSVLQLWSVTIYFVLLSGISSKIYQPDSSTSPVYNEARAERSQV